jgi:hypothetical protein
MKVSEWKPGPKTQQASQDRTRPSSQRAGSGDESASHALVDGRPGAIAQRTLRGAINQSPRIQQLAGQQAAIATSPRQVAQRTLRRAINQSPRVQQLAERQAAISTSPRQVAQRQQQAQMAPRNAPVVQRAGTKPNQPSRDGRYRIKLSSEREKFSYDNRVALGLDGVLPQHYPLKGYWRQHDGSTGEVIAVDLRDGGRVDLKTPIPEPSGGKKLLCIDTVGFERSMRDAPNTAKDAKLFIDVKIGHYTKSGQQWALEGAGWFMQKFKQIEHDMKDTDRTSRDFGYDVDAGNLEAFQDAHVRAMKGQDKGKLRSAMVVVSEPLRKIEAAMVLAPVTFVGASVFIVLNLTDPLSSEVKIIDPDHPILLDAPEGLRPVPTGVMDESKMRGGRNWDAYKDKWQRGFGSGMTNFRRAWAHDRDLLPVPK